MSTPTLPAARARSGTRGAVGSARAGGVISPRLFSPLAPPLRAGCPSPPPARRQGWAAPRAAELGPARLGGPAAARTHSAPAGALSSHCLTFPPSPDSSQLRTPMGKLPRRTAGRPHFSDYPYGRGGAPGGSGAAARAALARVRRGSSSNLAGGSVYIGECVGVGVCAWVARWWESAGGGTRAEKPAHNQRPSNARARPPDACFFLGVTLPPHPLQPPSPCAAALPPPRGAPPPAA